MRPHRVDDLYAATGGPDFARLGEQVPGLGRWLRPSHPSAPAGKRMTIDWNNDEAIRQLTAATLIADFGLDVNLPADRLCPIVPGRLEYSVAVMNVALTLFPEQPHLIGLDVGTGASAIYPLLATTLLPARPGPAHPMLSMIGTELDGHSYAYAQDNIFRNNLQHRISLVKVDPPPPGNHSDDGEPSAPAIFPPSIWDAVARLGSGLLRVDFTLCNPPFYGSAGEIAALEGSKLAAPFARCTGGANEMICRGGEVAFVKQMVDESLLPDNTGRIGLCSSLIGKFSSVAPVVAHLRAEGVANYGLRILGGERGTDEGARGGARRATRRWVVLWSTCRRRIPDCSRARADPGMLNAGVLPRPSRWSLALSPPPRAPSATSPSTEETGAEEAWRAVLGEVWREAGVEALMLGAVEGGDEGGEEAGRELTRWQLVATSARGNTWTRAARRKRARAEVPMGSSWAEMTGGGDGAVGSGLELGPNEAWVSCEAWIEVGGWAAVDPPDPSTAVAADAAADPRPHKHRRLSPPADAPTTPAAPPAQAAAAQVSNALASPHLATLHFRWTVGPDAARADVEGLWGFVKSRLQ